LGVPARRAKELIRMVRESLAKKGYGWPGRKDFQPGNEGEGGTARSVKSRVNPRAMKAKRTKSTHASRKKLARGKAKSSH
jgi:hypothetical protein